MNYISKYHSPVGAITMASDGESLTGLWFDGQKYFCSGISNAILSEELSVFSDAQKWLDAYFKGECPDFTPALSLKGTAFQMQVWELLMKIPYGSVVTYGDIARQLAEKRGISRMSSQAVGGAVGHNPISIIVPCHRVVGTNGSLAGYAGGIDKKEYLLKLEKALG